MAIRNEWAGKLANAIHGEPHVFYFIYFLECFQWYVFNFIIIISLFMTPRAIIIQWFPVKWIISSSFFSVFRSLWLVGTTDIKSSTETEIIRMVYVYLFSFISHITLFNFPYLNSASVPKLYMRSVVRFWATRCSKIVRSRLSRFELLLHP